VEKRGANKKGTEQFWVEGDLPKQLKEGSRVNPILVIWTAMTQISRKAEGKRGIAQGESPGWKKRREGE